MEKGYILKKRKLSDDVYNLQIFAPDIAEHYQPGQFAVVIPDEKGERIPLTISNFNVTRGCVSIYFLVVGSSTYKLSCLNEGDKVAHILGPLGRPSQIEKFGTVLCAGGGVGIATLYPVVRRLKEAGNTVVSVLSARTAERLILEKDISEYSDETIITTDDGSRGIKGLITLGIQTVASKRKIDKVFCVGPIAMMHAIADLTEKMGIPTVASLNPIMVDATGMCGACRVTVGGQQHLACVDGPEFDAHKIDFAELRSRLAQYRPQEKISLDKVKGQCREK